MTAPLHVASTTARLDEAIRVSPPHLVPVLLAVRNHGVGMLFIPQGVEAFSMPDSPASAVLLIGDDMHTSVGPGGFHLSSMRRAIRECSTFTVVTSEPTAAIYAAGALGAVIGNRVAIIETRIEHEFEWVALIQKIAPGKPILLATVKGGTA